MRASGRLDVPQLLLGGGERRDAVRLVSVVLDQPPRPADEAVALYMRNGWHGSPEVVEALRRALRAQPDDLETLWYLGLSLYDVGQHRQALRVFQGLADATRGDTAQALKHDWARVWAGHALDALGERERALTFYQSVLDSPAGSEPLQMGQYGIGPISATDWARRRLETPFVWPA
jgi:tetratricopeptide (TPR) repeat protein